MAKEKKTDGEIGKLTEGGGIRGLNETEASESRRLHGSNRFSEKKRQSFFSRLLKAFGDPIIRILLCALGVTLLLPGGNNLDALGIAVAVLISTVVSTACEYGSERAFEAMQREAGEQTCRIIRDGVEKTLSVGEAVVGDAIRLRAGERIPADGRLIQGTLTCDLSALNGESAEQRRYADESWLGEAVRSESFGDGDRLGDRSSLFRGSEITSGEGVMVVTSVGDNTYYGRMAVELQNGAGDSPLKIKLSKLAKTLSKFGYFCALLVGVSNLLFNTVFSTEFVFSPASLLSEVMGALTLAVSVVVMAVPEGLPMMITVVLASNMVKMQKERVLVRKPVGIEAAGSINILFTDKTGTLTYGKPQVSGYSFYGSSANGIEGLPPAIRRLLRLTAAYACGSDVGFAEAEASVRKGRGKEKRKNNFGNRMGKRGIYNKYEVNSPSCAGDAADIAFKKAFFTDADSLGEERRLAYLPFNSNDKLCAATISLGGDSSGISGGGNELTLIKGAPEILLERCELAYADDGSVRPMDNASLLQRLRSLASNGMRVIAVVTSECGAEAVRMASEQAAVGERVYVEKIFNKATFVSFVCLKDNLREEATAAIAELHGAGVQTVMITGDNPFTAEAIAKECGILPRGDSIPGETLTGSELAAVSDEQLAEMLPRIRVIARALPQDKSRLVRVASSLGMIVGMTGDGLNDAPALKQADVGFAMGSGTEIAKEAGDIVITNNNIASIVKAVHFGRTIFRSIRKFIVFQLAMNLCAVGISVIAPFIGYESPISVIQMLWINIIIDTLAAIAFAGEVPLPSYMRESPLPKNTAVLSSEMLLKILVLGGYTLLLCTYFLSSSVTSGIFASGEERRLLTGFFALFIFSGIIGSLNARSNSLNPFRGLAANPIFLLVMSGVFTAQVAMIYYGGVIFGTVPLTYGELGYVLLLSSTVIPVGRLYELFARRVRAGRNVARTYGIGELK